MKILRSGHEYAIKVFIVELPREVAEVVQDKVQNDTEAEILAGLTVMDITKEIIKQLGFNKDERGVVVVRVEPGSPADEAEIKRGDIIKEMDEKEVDDMEDFNRIASNIKKNETVLFFINRGGKRFYVVLKAS
jgi:serine protease Do